MSTRCMRPGRCGVSRRRLSTAAGRSDRRRRHRVDRSESPSSRGRGVSDDNESRDERESVVCQRRMHACVLVRSSLIVLGMQRRNLRKHKKSRQLRKVRRYGMHGRVAVQALASMGEVARRRRGELHSDGRALRWRPRIPVMQAHRRPVDRMGSCSCREIWRAVPSVSERTGYYLQVCRSGLNGKEDPASLPEHST